jgi:L-threonylcarbamoyladenylate synthase
MEIKKIKISSKNLKLAIKKIISIIKKGGVIVCPTDTIYGLIANAKDKRAVEKIFKIKKREKGKPLPIFVKNLKMAKKLAIIEKNQERILKRVWPGKVTAILRAKNKTKKLFPPHIVSAENKIGLRVPKHKILNILLEKLNLPLTATSANISGKKGSTKINDILKQFKNKKILPDLILDDNNLKPSPPSTVIDLTNFKILRRGAISKKEILKYD